MTADPLDAARTDERSRGNRIAERRRSVLVSVGAGLAATLAGCLGDGGGSSAGNGRSDATDTSTATERSGNLDLREANVVGVEIERSGDSYTFDVTLHHDDDGEQGYANWWQVETTSGRRLGRRELLHSHGSEPFTRSETISVPQRVSRVVVRGHDETHGYGGQAMVVTLASGETRAVGQGSNPRTLGNESGS